MILAQSDFKSEVRSLVIQERQHLEKYIEQHPEFSCHPDARAARPLCPAIGAGNDRRGRYGQGWAPWRRWPCAAIAARVGQALMPLSHEVIVENGGDIFMHVQRPATVSPCTPGAPL